MYDPDALFGYPFRILHGGVWCMCMGCRFLYTQKKSKQIQNKFERLFCHTANRKKLLTTARTCAISQLHFKKIDNFIWCHTSTELRILRKSDEQWAKRAEKSRSITGVQKLCIFYKFFVLEPYPEPFLFILSQTEIKAVDLFTTDTTIRRQNCNALWEELYTSGFISRRNST